MNVQNNVTKVLIAHITENKKEAEDLKNHLGVYGGDGLEWVLWEENRRIDLQELRGKIDETDLLLLLITNGIVESDDWGWLLWAAIMSHEYDNNMNDGNFPRLLLHNAALNPPQYIQTAITRSFESEADEILEFLRYFFGSNEFTHNGRGLNETLTEQDVRMRNLARDIKSLFQEPQKQIISQESFPKAITLIIENPKTIKTNKELRSNTQVKTITSKSLEIFDLNDDFHGNLWKWGEIVNRLPQERSQGWLLELEDSILSFLKGGNIRTVQSTFRSKEGKLFKPILSEMERWSDNSEHFNVLFVEHITEGWVYNAPSTELATLLTALTLGARLQWAVCRKYLSQLERWQRKGQEALSTGFRQIKESFRYIEEDARVRRQGEAPEQENQARLRDSFDSEEERQIIVENMNKQSLYKETLLKADEEGDINQVRNALTELARLNKIVMVMAAKRYSQLLNDI